MSVYIHGMEMPTEGRVIVIDSSGQVWTNEWPTRGYFRNEKAKAVPVPPHGRLIDADALLKDIAPTDEDEDNGAKLLMNVFCQVVKTRSTIIPAEEGE